jgi:hypothetical protein
LDLISFIFLIRYKSFVTLDVSGHRSEIPYKFLNVVVEKDEGD